VDDDANRVFHNISQASKFFSEVFKRRFFNKRSGLTLNAFIHYGNNFNNAFWDGEQFIFGDGDEVFFKDFASPFDVACHEYTHGVTQYEANFIYWKQSGALNESISDVFASLAKQYLRNQTADQGNWLLGEELLTDKIQSGKPDTPAALRSMKDPGSAYDDPVWGKDPQPKHMNDFVDTGGDYGGVHINSGIPNHAFYLVSNEIGGYSFEKAGHIWYQALADRRLRRDTQFLTFALATIRSARRLGGAGSDEVRSVINGWRQVGVLGKAGEDTHV